MGSNLVAGKADHVRLPPAPPEISLRQAGSILPLAVVRVLAFIDIAGVQRILDLQ